MKILIKHREGQLQFEAWGVLLAVTVGVIAAKSNIIIAGAPGALMSFWQAVNL